VTSRWHSPLLARPALALAAVAGVFATASCSSSGPSGVSRSVPPPVSSLASPPAEHSSAPHSHPPTSPSRPVNPIPAARAAARRLVAGFPAGTVSIAARNLATGAHFSAGATKGMWTASSYKLYVLENLLLHRQPGGLSSSEVAQATTMIENSDNAAGYSLYLDGGGVTALQETARRLGMTHTVPWQVDPTLTTTSAPDCLHLLHALVHNGPLDANSRALVLRLMRGVEADQRWGVGVVADPGTTFANKNGWLSVDNSNGPGYDDNGLWVVTSLGIVTVHGQRLLMAVLTQHQPDFDHGVALVQRLARALAPTVSAPRGDRAGPGG
jgi:beta-lactamase class A